MHNNRPWGPLLTWLQCDRIDCISLLFSAFYCISLLFTVLHCIEEHFTTYFTLHWGAEHITSHLCTRFHSGGLHSCNCGSSSSSIRDFLPQSTHTHRQTQFLICFFRLLVSTWVKRYLITISAIAHLCQSDTPFLADGSILSGGRNWTSHFPEKSSETDSDQNVVSVQCMQKSCFDQ